MQLRRATIDFRSAEGLHRQQFELLDGKTYEDSWLQTQFQLLKHPAGQVWELLLSPSPVVTLEHVEMEVELPIMHNSQLFCNGYQSWTDSRMFRPSEHIPALGAPVNRMFPQYGDYYFQDYPASQGKFHSYTYTYRRESDGRVLLFGSLDPSGTYTTFHWDARHHKLYIRSDCKGQTLDEPTPILRILLVEGSEQQALHTYFKALNLPANPKNPATGWTSWYNYYTNIDESIILNNLEAFASRRTPIDIFQIDDGWQKAIGDWQANAKFPEGMGVIAKRIHERGYQAGLWMAPFIVSRHAQILKDKPHFLLRNDRGKPVKAGWNPGWNNYKISYFRAAFFALDIFNPEVQDHLARVFDAALNTWSFDMLKLDFLYAACIQPPMGMSRGQAMRKGLELIRQWTGQDKALLGCGVPLGPAWGLFEYCRIGSDIHLDWEFKLLNRLHYRERPSTYNSLLSTVGRSHQNGAAWWNDPDVFMLRTENQKHNPTQQYTLFLANQIFGGLVFTSDNIANYSADVWNLYRSSFPFKTKKIIHLQDDEHLIMVRFSLPFGRTGEELEYLAYLNLCNHSRNVQLPAGVGFRRGEGLEHEGYQLKLAPHESKLFLLANPKPFSILHSSHLFPGSEVEQFWRHEHNLHVHLDPRAQVPTELWISLPNDGIAYTVNGRPVNIVQNADGRIAKVELGV